MWSSASAAPARPTGATAPSWAPELAALVTAAHPEDAETALARHEQAMFARAEAVEADDDMYARMIDDNAPHSTLALMTGGTETLSTAPRS
ncbi:hypothetical protein [Streptacidiphilus anmyonensis]|uniref:hypothetical protein n=1 Tax=Streptacidiphilus anmyonensis TaxID=405782 RepID=UPI0005A8A6EF|nr:hypothetical protein [Streptacidiphilus anmyonensis]